VNQPDPPNATQPRTLSWVWRIISTREDMAASFEKRNWAAIGEPIHPEDRLWKQYLVLVDLYKYYLDVAWKVSVWYYGVTGLILVYFFDHIEADDSPYLPLVLLFLSWASATFAYLYWRGAKHMDQSTSWMEHIAFSLRLTGRPHGEFAVAFLLINCVMLTTATVVFLVAFIAFAFIID